MVLVDGATTGCCSTETRDLVWPFFSWKLVIVSNLLTGLDGSLQSRERKQRVRAWDRHTQTRRHRHGHGPWSRCQYASVSQRKQLAHSSWPVESTHEPQVNHPAKANPLLPSFVPSLQTPPFSLTLVLFLHRPLSPLPNLFHWRSFDN